MVTITYTREMFDVALGYRQLRAKERRVQLFTGMPFCYRDPDSDWGDSVGSMYHITMRGMVYSQLRDLLPEISVDERGRLASAVADDILRQEAA